VQERAKREKLLELELRRLRGENVAMETSAEDEGRPHEVVPHH
jgi:hypothetical protein